MALTVTIAIIARNEQANIGATIASLAAQDLFTAVHPAPELVVLANGCTDRTVAVAEAAIAEQLSGRLAQARVVDTPIGGKSRAWNMVVHEVASPAAEVFLFLDADIELAGPDICRAMIEQLLAQPTAVACTGHPVKQIARKRRKSAVDRLSLNVSEINRHDRAISGQLYCARGEVLRDIWLPEPTPGEDGFLNAMVQTWGFSRPTDCDRVTQMERVTHYYEPAPLGRVFAHEQRMVIGTTVNMWLFEHLMELRAGEPLGPLIGARNASEPGWVGQLVSARAGNRRWVVPRKLLFWRMPAIGPRPGLRDLPRLAVGLVATAFSLVVAVAANVRLKQGSAAGYW
jgi:hypothetical protein